MIRPATLADIEAIFGLALKDAQSYSMLKPDYKKMRKVIMMSISGANHFCWVSENDGEVDGALIGLTSDNLWAQRKNCFVALWKSRKPGVGLKLLLAFKEWVQDRRGIRVAGFVPDSDHIDTRAYLLAERVGFRKCGGAYLLYN
jgi:RimJ/RimL family protein N-acetyltransferase